MKSYSCINVEDYLIDSTLDEKEITSVMFNLPQGLTFADLNTSINTVFEDGKILIPEKELFDVIEIFGDSMSDVEMNVLSTSMLKAIQETNFKINEVHYRPFIDFGRYTVDNYPYYGNNTSISEIVKSSFSFYNPNEYVYYFILEQDEAGDAYLKLIGLPFEYGIEISINKTILDYITRETDDVDEIRDGHQGVIVEVFRTITDKNGVSSKSLIVYEFYPPEKQINHVND
jgi:hypothetical protein